MCSGGRSGGKVLEVGVCGRIFDIVSFLFPPLKALILQVSDYGHGPLPRLSTHGQPNRSLITSDRQYLIDTVTNSSVASLPPVVETLSKDYFSQASQHNNILNAQLLGLAAQKSRPSLHESIRTSQYTEEARQAVLFELGFLEAAARLGGIDRMSSIHA